jgi:HSP20 family protein
MVFMNDLRMEPELHNLGPFQSEGLFRLINGPTNWSVTIQSRSWSPPTDVFETDDSIVVKVEIAGMAGHEFSIHLSTSSISISGIRPPQSGRCAYYQMEILSGEFLTEVELPSPIDADHISADYNDGFLSVTLPKVQPQHIPVTQD